MKDCLSVKHDSGGNVQVLRWNTKLAETWLIADQKTPQQMYVKSIRYSVVLNLRKSSELRTLSKNRPVFTAFLFWISFANTPTNNKGNKIFLHFICTTWFNPELGPLQVLFKTELSKQQKKTQSKKELIKN
jgi:hypothetical protein